MLLVLAGLAALMFARSILVGRRAHVTMMNVERSVTVWYAGELALLASSAFRRPVPLSHASS